MPAAPGGMPQRGAQRQGDLENAHQDSDTSATLAAKFIGGR